MNPTEKSLEARRNHFKRNHDQVDREKRTQVPHPDPKRRHKHRHGTGRENGWDHGGALSRKRQVIRQLP